MVTRWFPRALVGALVRTAMAAAMVAVVAVPATAWAQRGGAPARAYHVTDSARFAHMVQVSPHRVVLMPGDRTATLTFSNTGDVTVEAEIEVQCAYPVWPSGPAELFEPNAAAKRRPRDTVIVDPSAEPRYAGRWLSGLPSRVVLAPNETRRVTLTIDPPAGIPDGEYFARVTTVMRKRVKPPKAKDEKATFRMPIVGTPPPEVRDSADVFYRTGRLESRMQVLEARGAIDPVGRETPRGDFGAQQLWMLFRVRPTGNAHFDGQMSMFARAAGGETYLYTPAFEFQMYKEGVMRFWAKTSHLPRGRYTMVVTFGALTHAGRAGGDVPVTPTTVELPFEVR